VSYRPLQHGHYTIESGEGASITAPILLFPVLYSLDQYPRVASTSSQAVRCQFFCFLSVPVSCASFLFLLLLSV